MSFELERVWAGVGAVGALVRPLPRVTTDVSLQFRVLHTLIVTFSTLNKKKLYNRFDQSFLVIHGFLFYFPTQLNINDFD